MPKALTTLHLPDKSETCLPNWACITTNVNHSLGGCAQALSARFDNVTDPNVKIVTGMTQAKDGACGVLVPHEGRSWGHSCGGSVRGGGNRRICMQKTPLKDATRYVSELGVGTAPLPGYEEVANFAWDTIASKKGHALLARFTPFNYYTDTLCNQNANLALKDCQEYFMKNRAYGDSRMHEYCTGINLETPICRSYFAERKTPTYTVNLKRFCSDNNGEKFAAATGICRYTANNDSTGWLDDSVANFCQYHPTDPYCTCSAKYVNSFNYGNLPPYMTDQYKKNPLCYNKECSQTGYKFKWARDVWNLGKSCPPLQFCNIDIKDVKLSEIKNIKCEQTMTLAQEKTSSGATSAPKPAPTTTRVTEAPPILPTPEPVSGAISGAESGAVLGPIPASGQYLPLPEAIREMTNKTGLSDNILIGLLGLILILLYMVLSSDSEPGVGPAMGPTSWEIPPQQPYYAPYSYPYSY